MIKNPTAHADWEAGEWTPAPFRAVCRVTPTPKNGLTDPMIVRIGDARTLEAARQMVADDKREMSSSVGGLIDAPGISGREYRIFRSAGWEVGE